MNSVMNIYRSASSYVAKQLMKGLSIEDKLKMVKLMRNDLDEQPSIVRLYYIDAKGVKKPYKSLYSYDDDDVWANLPYFRSDLKNIQVEMCVAMEHTKKLADDESSHERAVRGFIEFMTEIYMTNECELKGNYNNPMTKTLMDAGVIEGFVEAINRWHKGLTQEQCDRVNKIVIGLFKEQIVLDRALNQGVLAFPRGDEWMVAFSDGDDIDWPSSYLTKL